MKNSIGLEMEKSKELVKKLNFLLCNFQIHYQNLRGFHWNIKGKNFFDLHSKFEEYYTDAQEKIDMIAERILTLEGVPYHTFEGYLKNNSIKIAENVSNDEDAIKIIAEALSIIIKIERDIMILSTEISDEGTNSMISDFISQQEKIMWMLKSWLK